MRIQLKDDFRELQKDLHRLETKTLNTATVRTLNKLGDKAYSVSRKMMSDEGGIKPMKKLNRYIRKGRATRSKQYFDIFYDKGYFNLYRDFNAKQTKEGTVAKVWGRKQVYKGTFLAEVGIGGHIAVFKRIGGRRSGKRKVLSGKNIGRTYRAELPIREVFGPSIRGMYRKLKIETVVEKLVSDNLDIEFRRALRSLGVNL